LWQESQSPFRVPDRDDIVLTAREYDEIRLTMRGILTSIESLTATVNDVRVHYLTKSEDVESDNQRFDGVFKSMRDIRESLEAELNTRFKGSDKYIGEMKDNLNSRINFLWGAITGILALLITAAGWVVAHLNIGG
jgi:uncharacterized protein YoxC